MMSFAGVYYSKIIETACERNSCVELSKCCMPKSSALV